MYKSDLRHIKTSIVFIDVIYKRLYTSWYIHTQTHVYTLYHDA